MSVATALELKTLLPATPFDAEHLHPPASLSKLTPVPGSPFHNLLKAVHGMRICDVTGQVLYLCTWEQDLVTNFFTPSWVLAPLIMTDRGYKAIALFY